MKLSKIYSTLLCGALAQASHSDAPKTTAIAKLTERGITIENDPIRFSVLSVLHDVLPSDAFSIMTAQPTPFSDASPPEWYNKLPEDVKGLLPVLYPKAAEVGSTGTDSSTSTSTTTTTLTITRPHTVTGSPTSAAASSSASKTPAPTSQAKEIPNPTSALTAAPIIASGAPSGHYKPPYVNATVWVNITTAGPSSNITTWPPAQVTTNGQGQVAMNVFTTSAIMGLVGTWFALMG